MTQWRPGWGWASGWLVTCFLIIPSLASLRSLTRMSQRELQQTKQQLGSRGRAAARARLLMAIIQCFMIRHQPGYWGPSSWAEYIHPGMSPIRRNSKSCEAGRHFSDTRFAAGADWAGLWVMMGSLSLWSPPRLSVITIRTCLRILVHRQQPRLRQSTAMTFGRREKDRPWLSWNISCQTSNWLWDLIWQPGAWMMMLLGKGWILDGKLISTDDCLVSCGAHCSMCRCMHCLWQTPAGKDWCNPNFLQVRSVSSSVIIPNITHTVTPSQCISKVHTNDWA